MSRSPTKRELQGWIRQEWPQALANVLEDRPWFLTNLPLAKITPGGVTALASFYHDYPVSASLMAKVLQMLAFRALAQGRSADARLVRYVIRSDFRRFYKRHKEFRPQKEPD